MKSIYTIALFISFFLQKGYASTDFFFSHLGVQDGLSHVSVYAILQDSDGYLWFGTRNGLNKFNGYEFETYYKESQNEQSLSDGNINAITEDTQKNKWIGTDNGLNRIDYQTGQVTRIYPRLSNLIYPSNKVNLLFTSIDGQIYGTIGAHVFACNQRDSIRHIKKLPENITCITQVANRDIYLSTLSAVYIFSDDWQLKRQILSKPECSFPTPIVSMLVEDNGDLWIGTRQQGLFFYNHATDAFSVFNVQNSSLQSNYARSLVAYGKEQLLIGTPEGLYLVDKKELSLSAINLKVNQGGGASHHSIFCMFVDKDQTLWIGTFAGINYYSMYNKSISLIPSNEFAGIINKGQLDEAGNIWFATEGAGLMFYNPQTRVQKLYPIKPIHQKNFHTNIIKTIFIEQDKIWCGTHTGEIYLFDIKSGHYQPVYNFRHNDIYALLLDHKKRLWVPTNSSDNLVLIENGVKRNSFRANGKEVQFYGISAITEIEPDLFLLGSLFGSISLYDYKNETLLDIFPLPAKQQDQLGTISSILADSSSIWISTLKNGLFRFDRNLTLIKQYTKADGLLSDCYISSIVIDSEHELWLATGKELYVLNREEDKFYAIRPVNTSPLAYSVHGGFSTPDGIVYFPGNNGIIAIRTKQITKNRIVPTIRFASLTTNENKKIDLPTSANATNPIHLNATQNNLTIQYVALNYIHAADNQYMYKMDGVDGNWQQVGAKRVAYYHKLPPGKYVFRLKASNNDGIWNPKEAVLAITIDPPFYKTGWAYVLYLIVLLLVVYKIVRYQHYKLKLEQEIHFKQKEQERMQELHNERIRMFHNFSHELRTPLTLIINPLEDMLQRIPFSHEVKQALLLMKKNTKRMLILVNDLMDVQKYEAGKFILNKSPFEFCTFITEIVHNFENTAESRHITFTLENHLQAPFSVNLDEKEMRKVFFNLLSNAFKYTPSHGVVTLRIRLVSKQELTLPPSIMPAGNATSSFLYLEVADTGKGFSREEGEKIFEPFYSFSADIHQQLLGTGIGLSLVRSIVAQHEGAVWAESSPNAGSRFMAILPYVESHIQSPVQLVNKAVEKQEKALLFLKEGEALQKPVLLIVEDDKEMRLYLSQQLSETYIVFTAQNGAEAFEKINCRPQLIISDVIMPQMNGLDLCKKIKLNPQTANISIILLTAQSITSQIEEGLAAGADDYIIKPFEINILKARIKNLLLKSEKKQPMHITSATISHIECTANSKKNDFLVQYVDVVKKNLSNPELDVQFICDTLCVGRTNFYRKSKELTPLSPVEFIKSIRLEVAAQLLRETELNISEVIQQTGYSSRSYFSKSFKEVYGTSPSEYRKKTDHPQNHAAAE